MMWQAQKIGSRMGVGSVLLAVFAMLAAGSASAQPQASEVREYQRDFQVSERHAQEVLMTQHAGLEVDIAGELESLLGGDYAGVWFDNETGEFVVPLAPGAERGTAARALNAAGLSGQFRFVSVESSWEKLQTAQDEINEDLADLFEAEQIQTSIDPRTNAVVIKTATGIGENGTQEISRSAESSNVVVETKHSTAKSIAGRLEGCNDVFCGLPLRGGVKIYGSNSSNPEDRCTAGFRAQGDNGGRYLLTAGHCVVAVPGEPATTEWFSKTDTLQPFSVGVVEQAKYPSQDWAKININGTAWDKSPWTHEVVYYGAPIWGEKGIIGKTAMVDPDYAITGEAQSVVGTFACHSGIMTGSTCGEITAQDVTHFWANDGVEDLYEIDVCSIPGDSGGPYFAGHTALGMHTGSRIESGSCEERLYTDITKATDALNVTVTPPAQPYITVNASSLNGNPGWVTLKGEVRTPSGTGLNGSVQLKLLKWENNNWVDKATLGATASNGNYEFSNWNGVGPGAWIAKAIFPAQGGYQEASSSVITEGSFEVKDGYQLISTVSNKCADVQYSSLENGAPVWQFGCWSPVRAGQVFWIKPISGPYVQLINKNSKKCMETRNVSQTAGETMQQWSCGWLAQESQLWQKVDVAGGSKFVVKHSGQCLDLYLSGTQDGNKIDQHPCNGTNAQVWQVKSVNSEPAKPEVFLTISGVQPGQPGFFDISGNVKQGDYPVNGKPVFIDFERLVGSVWQKEPGLTKEVKADSTGYYVLVNNFVGRGTYRAHARLNSELPLLGGAESGNHQFQIGMGYRLASKLAPNKCLSVNNGSWNQGAPILLWDCSPNPQGGDGQVITWSPVNGIWPHRQIVFNGSKLCLDVPGVKQDDGLQLQQWACNVAGQDNQLWTGSGGEYQEFRVKHSGKCIDLWFSGTQNGNKIDQHACNGTNAQKWKFQYIP